MSLLLVKPDLVIYHGNCPDGIAGAWCLWDYLGRDTTKFHAGRFNEKPLNVKEKHVLFIDFSYNRKTIEKLLDIDNPEGGALSITVLDHHKSTEDLLNIKHPNFYLVLDMDRSGSQLGWDYMQWVGSSTLNTLTNHLDQNTLNTLNTINTLNTYPDQKTEILPSCLNRPWFIEDIADRDLWRWTIPNSRYTTRALLSMGYYESLEKFNTLNSTSNVLNSAGVLNDNDPTQSNINDFRSSLISIGMLLIKEDEKTYETIRKNSTDCICHPPKDPSIAWKVRLVCGTGVQASDIGNMLVKDELCDFAAIWRYELKTNEWLISLRANNKSAVDLTEVCKLFDSGGGHAKAAGIILYGNKGQTLNTVFFPVKKHHMFHLKV